MWINYDTGNLPFYSGLDPVAEYERVHEYVVHVHMKDTSGRRGDWAFGTLGTGHVDLPSIVRMLRERDFHGPYSLEVEGFAGEDVTRETRVQRVRDSLAYLRNLGIQAWPNDN